MRIRSISSLLAAIAVVAVPFSSGCLVVRGPSVEGSGTSASETRTVESFDRVELRAEGTIDVEIRLGEPAAVELTGDDNLLPHIETTSRNGKLVISSDARFRSRAGMNAVITAPALSEVTILGSARVEIPDVRGERLDVTINGSGEIFAAGEVDTVDASINGSGDIRMGELVARSASARIAGSGDIVVHATEELDASIAGSGDIAYFGEPEKLNRRIAGSGDIRGR